MWFGSNSFIPSSDMLYIIFINCGVRSAGVMRKLGTKQSNNMSLVLKLRAESF